MMVWVPALSLIVMVMDLATAPFGSNVTEKVQRAPELRLVGQLFDWLKLEVLPLVLMVMPVSVEAVSLMSDDVFAADFTPTV